MPLDRVSILGNPNIGVYIFANNKVALIPPGLPNHVKRKIGDTLGVETIEARVAGSPLLGIFLAGNDKGVLAPRIIADNELRALEEVGISLKVFPGKFTALGNVVLSNNTAALLHPDLSDDEVRFVADALRIDKYIKGTIAKIPTVGSAAVVTDKGGAVHPDAEDEELHKLEKFFGVPLDIATVNFGVAFIKTGLVANNYGALVGEKTTGPEIMRIMKALNMGE
jgi:translation initiation factor 6